MNKKKQVKQNKRPWKSGIIILSVLVILVLVFNIIELGKYMNRKKEADKYADMKITVTVDTPIDLV